MFGRDYFSTDEDSIEGYLLRNKAMGFDEHQINEIKIVEITYVLLL